MTSTNSKYSFDDFMTVLVLYRTVLEESSSFKTLVHAAGEAKNLNLFVYDNSPVSQNRPEIFESSGLLVRYLTDTGNPGIGKAYNAAVDFAQEKNKKWILFLDQDTQVATNMLDLYLESVNSERDMHIFATTLYGADGQLISPSKYWFKRGFQLDFVPEGRVSLKTIRPINSLLLLSIEVFEKVGGYNEKIKLDFSDHEFLGRVEQHYKEMFVIGGDNRHSLSSSDDSNLESIKSRFIFFCQGAHEAGVGNFVASLQYFTVCLLRATRLGLKFKTGYFLKVLVKEWMG